MQGRPNDLPQFATNYEAIVAAVPDAIFIQDAAGHLLDVNPAACAMFGYPRDVLVGRHIGFLAAQDHYDAEAAERSLQRAIAGQPHRFAWWGRRADGTVFPAEVTLTGMVFAGHPAVIAVARDQSTRHEAEARLRASEERFRALVDAAPMGIVIHSGTPQVYSNATLRRMVGLADHECDWSPVEMVTAEYRDVIADRMRRRLAGLPVESEYEVVAQRRDGTTFPARVLVSTVALPDGPCIIGFITDESERYADEERRRQSQRMEAIGRLAGGVAHDFNNLLTAILSYTTMIECELPDGHPVREDVEQIRLAGERAASLTRQLLAFGRRQRLAPKPVLLNTVVTDLNRMLRRLIGENIELVTQLSPSVGTVLADPGQIEQVIMNLVVNARDALPGGGRVTIRTATVTVDAPAADRLRYLTPGSYVRLTVTDTGAGIAPEVLPHIFEPFFTTKEAGKGTGLGLATVYGIVKQSGGYVYAENAPAGGAVFSIYLPLVEGPAVPAEPAPDPAVPSARGTGETILLVEDDPLVRRLTRDLLRRHGYDVIEVADGEAALAVLAAPGRRVDLLLTDMVMPRLSGRELVDRMPRERAGLPVLFVSGYTDSALPPAGAPGVAFLPKPYTPASLTRTVRDLLAGAAAGAS